LVRQRFVAKKKSEKESAKSFWEDIKRTADEFDKQNPVVDTKYIVVEGWYAGNEYDYNIDWFKWKEYEFDSLDAREEWVGEHEPDRGHEFRLAKQDVRKFHPKPYTSRTPMTWERTND
jgi:hypothetical protein